MAILKLICENQKIRWETPPEEIYSGNIKIDSVQFEFCKLWEGFTKTAVFIRDNEKPIQVLLNDDAICDIPPEVSQISGVINIGVFGIKGEQRRTSEVKSFYFNEGVPTEGVISEPTPDIYQQIINLCAETVALANSVREDADNGVFDGEDYILTETDKQEIAAMASGIPFYVCSESEIDENGKPIIENPETDTFYLTPSGEESPNLFTAWAYINGAWERFEGGLPDFTNFIKNTDYATTTKHGIIKVENERGTNTTSSGVLQIIQASTKEINNRASQYKPIVPATLDYAVKKSLADCTLEGEDVWTEEEKSNARELLGAVGKEDYGNSSKAGLVKTSTNLGLNINPNSGDISIARAPKSVIDGKQNSYRPITPDVLDYAVKVGVTTNTETLTPEEQTTAQAWLGGQMIKQVPIDSEGNLNVNTWTWEDGLYRIPPDVLLKGDNRGKSIGRAYKVDWYLKIADTTSGDHTSDTEKAFLGIGGLTTNHMNSEELFFGYVKKDGTFSHTKMLALPFISDIRMNETFSGVKTFSAQPIMAAELPLDDNSTKIPNTQWVNQVLSKSIGDIEVALENLHTYAQSIVTGGEA